MLRPSIFIPILIISSAFPVSSQPSPFGFKNQFIAISNSTTNTQSDLCDNYWCVNDANLLFTQSSQYENIDPCVDFRNFSLSNSLEVDQVSDRKVYRNLFLIVEEKKLERTRRVLSAKVKESDNRIERVLKQTFQKCLRSPHPFRHLEAHRDVLDYLSSFGGSPYLSKHISFNPNKFNADVDYKIGSKPGPLNVTWNEENFDFEKIFMDESHHAMALFFSLTIGRCFDGKKLCIPTTGEWPDRSPDFSVYHLLKDMLEGLEDFYLLPPQFKELLDSQVFVPAAENVKKFLDARDEILNEFFDENLQSVKIKELRKFGNVNWTEVINRQLMEESHVKDEDEILVKPKLFTNMVENLERMDKGSTADTFVIMFLYMIRNSVLLRFFNKQDYIKGFKQSPVRHEICIKKLNDFIQPAVEVMYENERPKFDYYRGDFNRNAADHSEIIESARRMAVEALDDFRKRFTTGVDLPLSKTAGLLEKLKKTKIIVGFTNETLKTEELEEFYKELNLTGSESFFTSLNEIRKNSYKIDVEAFGSWRQSVNQLTRYYDLSLQVVDGNFLYIPPLWLIYPYYHPLRPRFFNMALLYQSLIFYMSKGMLNYFHQKFNIKPLAVDFTFEDNFQVAYESYTKWLKSNTELRIGANQLTNQQLYWIAMIVNKNTKLHRNAPKDFFPTERLQLEYLNAWIKNKPGFLEAFNCTQTEEDKKLFVEYQRKNVELLN